MDIAAAGQRLVSVGERGLIGVSDDAGKTWQQVNVPVSVTLTAVYFATPQVGWAVGHSGVVLHSNDGGATWRVQLDGRAAAKLVLQAAQADPVQGTAAAVRQLQAAERLTADGPDKPFLGVHFSDPRNGMVVGAYGLIFRTDDGGDSWKPWLNRVDNPKGLHFYSVEAVGDMIFVAGEQGLLLRSRDRGQSFTRIETPYRGSYFTLALGLAGEVLVAGLNGNAFWSGDGGSSWSKVGIAAQGSFVAARRTPEGAMLLANQGGQILSSQDGGRSFHPSAMSSGGPLSSFVALRDGGFVTVGLRGAAAFDPTSVNQGTKK